MSVRGAESLSGVLPAALDKTVFFPGSHHRTIDVLPDISINERQVSASWLVSIDGDILAGDGYHWLPGGT